jgi:hypothetical protein
MNQSDFAQTTNLKASIKPEHLRWWLPIDAVIDEGRPAIEWMDLRNVTFDEPFFHETVDRGKSQLKSRAVVTDLDFLLQLEKICDSVEPTGFIFHISRCGSTLLANACRELHGSIVMAEAPVLDKIASRFLTDVESNSAKELLYMLFLKAAVTALGQRRTETETRYFVKFACTTTLQMHRIRRIWPNLPFIFLYRDPVEVIVSNLKSIPEWMKPVSNPAAAAALVDVATADVAKLAPEEFCARALGRFLEEAKVNVESKTKFINYEQLTTTQGLIQAIRFLGVEPSNEEADAIQEVSRLYSKGPTRGGDFQSDRQAKQASASTSVRQMAAKWALPFYESLDNSQLLPE